MREIRTGGNYPALHPPPLQRRHAQVHGLQFGVNAEMSLK